MIERRLAASLGRARTSRWRAARGQTGKRIMPIRCIFFAFLILGSSSYAADVELEVLGSRETVKGRLANLTAQEVVVETAAGEKKVPIEQILNVVLSKGPSVPLREKHTLV